VRRVEPAKSPSSSDLLARSARAVEREVIHSCVACALFLKNRAVAVGLAPTHPPTNKMNVSLEPPPIELHLGMLSLTGDNERIRTMGQQHHHNNQVNNPADRLAVMPAGHDPTADAALCADDDNDEECCWKAKDPVFQMLVKSTATCDTTAAAASLIPVATAAEVANVLGVVPSAPSASPASVAFRNEPTTPPPPRRRRNKQVTFGTTSFDDNAAAAVNVTYHFIPALADLSLAERRACWWRNPDDFELFKRNAKRVCRDVRLQNSTVLQQLDGCYSDAKYLALTMEEDAVQRLLLQDTPDYNTTTNNNNNTSTIAASQRAVAAWAAAHGSTCRGLEHWTARRHAVNRLEGLQECGETVVELSRFRETAAEIAKQSREYSRASRLLARWWGLADAAVAAAANDDDDNDTTAAVVVKSPSNQNNNASSSSTTRSSFMPRARRRRSTGEPESPSSRSRLRYKIFR